MNYDTPKQRPHQCKFIFFIETQLLVFDMQEMDYVKDGVKSYYFTFDATYKIEQNKINTNKYESSKPK